MNETYKTKLRNYGYKCEYAIKNSKIEANDEFNNKQINSRNLCSA